MRDSPPTIRPTTASETAAAPRLLLDVYACLGPVVDGIVPLLSKLVHGCATAGVALCVDSAAWSEAAVDPDIRRRGIDLRSFTPLVQLPTLPVPSNRDLSSRFVPVRNETDAADLRLLGALHSRVADVLVTQDTRLRRLADRAGISARVLTIASVLGVYGVIASFGLFWIVRDYLMLPEPTVQALIFLKLLVSGHMTIYLTRNKGPIWERPWPSWKLVVPCEATQLIGTLVVVYGLFMEPTGWRLAALVWAYSLTIFLGASAVKLAAYRLMEHRLLEQARHLARVELSFVGRPAEASVSTMLLGLVAATAIGFGAYWAVERIEAPPTYRTAEITRGAVTRTIEATGVVEPTQMAAISARVPGIVESVSCDVDMAVQPGTVCARLNPRRYAEAVAAASANLIQAQAKLARNEIAMAKTRVAFDAAQRRRGRHPLSRRQRIARKAAYDAAQSQVVLDRAAIDDQEALLRAARIDLAATELIAPSSGIIVARNIAVGQRVTATADSAALFTIASETAEMRAEAHAPARDMGEIKVGDKASVYVENFPGRAFEASISKLRLTRTTQDAVIYDIALDVDNSQMALRPGMSASAKIIVARRTDALRVPDEALSFSPRGASPVPEGKARVWALREGSPEPVPLTLGLDDGEYSEILSGAVAPGDQVIVGD